MILLNYLEI